MTMGASAQYYYVPFLNAGTNPGGLNTDDEYPVAGGIPAGWTTIRAYSATPAWSTTQTLPFAFQFNGAPVTQYKVSTTGVLTFDVAAATVPAAANVALPAASIPNNSICIWGINGTGTNDNVVTKTFGVSGSQQFWVSWNSYTAGSCGWTYWSIVFEEGTNNIYIVDQRNAGGACLTTLGVTVGIQIDGTTAVQVAGSPSLNSVAASDPTVADNSYYAFMFGSQPAVQTKMQSVSINPYVVVPGSATVSGVIQNLGANNITAADIVYNVNGMDYTYNLTGLNVAPYATYNFTHATPLSITNPTMHAVKVWVNTAGDAYNADDTLTANVSGLTFLPTKRVLIEEATGTWCGWCPRGSVYTELVDQTYPGSALVVAVHNSDPMANAAYDAGMGNLISGYPSGLVDRTDIDIDPLDFESSYLDRVNDIPPADVNVAATFDASTRLATITISTLVAGELNGDYRLNAILVEDTVTGTGSGYNQVNYYSFQSNNIALSGAGHNWQTEPDPVLAANMEYHYVGREILGGWDGAMGSLPASLTANSSYSYTFNYTVPAGWNQENMRVIGMLQDATTGKILNSNRGFYGITTSISTVTAPEFSMGVYPNPANDFATLQLDLVKASSLTVEIFNMTGQVVHSQNIKASAGMNVLNLPVSQLQSGVYMIRVNVAGSKLTQRLVIN
jgi:hypothetical protein